MVRFLRATCESFESRQDLLRFVFLEKVSALAYIGAAFSFGLASLSFSGLAPYAEKHRWHLYLFAGIVLLVTHARDVTLASHNFFLSRLQSTADHLSPHHQHGRCSGGHLNLLSALMMAFASLTLVNASIIAVTGPESEKSATCSHQFALSFVFFLVGAASNNVANDDSLRSIAETRNLLGFQNVLTSSANVVGAVLLIPGVTGKENGVVRDRAVTFCLGLGGFIIMLSSLLNYFHTAAFIWNQTQCFEKEEHRRTTFKLTKMREQNIAAEEALRARGFLQRVRDALQSKKNGTALRKLKDEVDPNSDYTASDYIAVPTSDSLDELPSSNSSVSVATSSSSHSSLSSISSFETPHSAGLQNAGLEANRGSPEFVTRP